MIYAGALVAERSSPERLDLRVGPTLWILTGVLVAVLLLVDITVLHREAKVPTLRRASIEVLGWVLVAIAFGVSVTAGFGVHAGEQWFSGYLIELSLSVDNVFVWSLILTHFAVPRMYQHRVLFWGIFGAIVLRALFIFAGVALVNRFEVAVILFGAFLVYTAVKLVVTGDDDAVDPEASRFLAVVRRVVHSAPDLDGQRLFTVIDGRRMATPLFAVLILVEGTDVLFAVDSVPAVLGVSREQFLVLTSNAFAIMGLRAMYFLFADMRERFSYLQQGLAVILAFVGVRMIIERWFEIPIGIALGVIAAVLVISVVSSLQRTRSV